MATAAAVTESKPADSKLVHEAWISACRVDQLLSRFDPPPNSELLVEAILRRVCTGSQPPDPILMGHAAGFAASQWSAPGEVVQQQIGRLMLTIINHASVDTQIIAEAHMVISAAAARVSLDAWRNQAETDELTRLRNGYGLQADLEHLILQGNEIRIGFIDLDGLKQVNTSQGHDAGDRLIKKFAERLREATHIHSGNAYRPHGDEFIVTMPIAEARLDEILTQFASSSGFSFSFGVAEWPTDDDDIQTVQRNADKAMYKMKEEHHNAAAAERESQSQEPAEPVGELPASS